jgi:hypothetical protein
MKLLGAIVFVNEDISEQVLSALQTQLFITETISLSELLIRNTGNYIRDYKLANKRMLVVCDFWSPREHFELADVAIFIKAGLAYIEKDNFGPTEKTYNVRDLQLAQIIPLI